MTLKKKVFAICAALVLVFFLPKIISAVRHAKVPEIDLLTNVEPVKEVLKIVKISAASSTITFEYSAEPKFVVGWKSDADEIIINGAYFNEDFGPSGFLVVSSTRIGNLKFDEDKTGLLQVKQGKFTIRDLSKEPLQKSEKFDYALQSYPFLIKDGKPALTSDTGKIARRTAVGVDAEGNIYAILVGTANMSLFVFMEELIKTNIPFTYVLNVDGGPSSGMYVKRGEEEFVKNSYVEVPSIVRFRLKN